MTAFNGARARRRPLDVIAWLLLAALVSTSATRLVPELLALRVYNDDARIYTSSLWIELGATALNSDPGVAYVRSTLMPPGYLVLVATLVRAFDHPLALCNVGGFLLALLSCVLALDLVRARAGWPAATLAFFALWQSPGLWSWVAGAHPRAFAIPSVLLALWAWTHRREAIALLAQFLAAVTYPAAYALVAAVGGILLVIRLRRGKASRRFVVGFAVTHAAAIGVLLFWISTSPFGPPIRGHSALSTDPHWAGKRPRYDLYPSPPALQAIKGHGVALCMPFFVEPGHRRHLGSAMVAVAAIGGAIFIARRVRSPEGAPTALRRVSGGLVASSSRELLVIACSLVLFVLAKQVPFALYLPERYVSLGFVAVLPVTIPIVLSRCCPSACVPNGAACLALALAGAAAVLAEARRAPEDYAYGLRLSPEHAHILEEIKRATPEDAVIVCPGPLGDELPLWTGRATLWNYETYQVFHPQYYMPTDHRIRVALAALCSPKLEEPFEVLRSVGATHVFEDASTWASSDARRSIVVSPLFEELGEELAAATKERTLWRHLPATALIIEFGRDRLWIVQEP